MTRISHIYCLLNDNLLDHKFVSLQHKKKHEISPPKLSHSLVKYTFCNLKVWNLVKAAPILKSNSILENYNPVWKAIFLFSRHFFCLPAVNCIWNLNRNLTKGSHGSFNRRTGYLRKSGIHWYCTGYFKVNLYRQTKS